MTELFYDGGVLWMGIMTMALIAVLAVTVYKLRNIGKDTFTPEQFVLVKEIGLFALMLGIFFQALGLFHALAAIEMATAVSASVIATGIRVGMIPTLYGFLIYMLSIVLYIGVIAYHNRAKS